jgi:hypothetical protein
MRVHLRTLPAQSSGTTTVTKDTTHDLTLNVPDDAVLEPNAEITGTIAEANSGAPGAYVIASYPTLEYPGVGDLECGASIVDPATGLPRVLPVGTKITFQVAG